MLDKVNIYLFAAFDDIKWADCSMGETTGKDSTNHAF
jgi:hypothetical protein